MIIANNCIAADLYYSNKKKYDHPFMWCVLFHNDILNLIRYFDELNYDNYDLIKNEHINSAYNIIIDKKVKVQYLHYLKNENCKVPTKKKDRFNVERNIEYDKIERYIIEKYNKRKIIDKKIKPFIFIHLNKNTWQNDITENNIQDIIDECKLKNFPLVIFGKCNLKPTAGVLHINIDFKYPFEVRDFVNKNMKDLLRIALE